MKRCLALAVLVVTSHAAFAQTPEVVDKVEAKLATIRYVNALYDPATGGFKVVPDGKPSLRACNGAAKALSILGAKLPDKEKTAAFVLSCYDPKAGAFAEPGGKPDVTITSVGVMASVELGIPKEKFAKAMEYLKENAKSFEEVRIAAAAVEAWGVKDQPEYAAKLLYFAEAFAFPAVVVDDSARHAGAVIAMTLRLGGNADKYTNLVKDIYSQRTDGGWGTRKADDSDLESTYRVMRAFMLLQQKPAEFEQVKAFVAKCRNKDGGYGYKPGEPSSMSGVYYATIIAKWIADLEK